MPQKRVAFVSDWPVARELKLASGLAGLGYSVHLLCRNKPIFSGNTCFTQISLFESNHQLLEMIERIGPDICHVFTSYDYLYCIHLIQSLKDIPVILDPYDLIGGMHKDSYLAASDCLQDRIDHERYCLENADGVCCRHIETQYYRHAEKLRFRNRRALVLEGCWNIRTHNLRHVSSVSDIHVVTAGGMTVEKLDPGYHGFGGNLWVAEKLLSAGLNFHVYPTPHCYQNGFESDMSDYIELEKKSGGRFRIHKSLPYDRLIDEISQYDIGLNVFSPIRDCNVDALEFHRSTRVAFRYSTGNKIYDYMDAGLALLVDPGVHGWLMSRIRKHGVMLDIDNLLYSDRPAFDLNGFLAARSRIRAAAAAFSLTGQVACLDRYYNYLLDRRKRPAMNMLKRLDADSNATRNSTGTVKSEHSEVVGIADMNKSKLRFMQLDTFYETYLNSFYAAAPLLQQRSFAEQSEALFYDGFAAIHTLAPYMAGQGYDSQWILANNYPAQMIWARENGFSVPDPNEWMHAIVREQIERFKPDVLYTTDSMLFDSRFMRSLNWRPRLVIGWQASDIPLETDWREFDIILSPLAALRKTAVEIGAKSAEHFYPGFPLWIADRVSSVQPDLDLVFCGQWNLATYPRRNQLLHELASASVHGNRLKCGLFLSGQMDTLTDEVAQCSLGSRYGMEMYRALRRGRIGFDARGNIGLGLAGNGPASHDIAGRETANMRIFETTGVGTFLLTEQHDNVTTLFEPGLEIETYSSISELHDKISYYLAHSKELEEIAWNGQQRCFRDHSMTRRVEVLHRIIQEQLGIKQAETKNNVAVECNSTQTFRLKADNSLANIKAKALEQRFGEWVVEFRGMQIACHDLMAFYIAAKDIFIQRIYDFEAATAAPFVIDGGGHIGLFALYCKQKYPAARILVFEPDKTTLPLLRKNIQLNNLNNVEVIEACLYSTNGTLSFDSGKSDGSSIYGEEANTTIATVRLSEYIDGRVDFLKLNIEGAELEVISEIESRLPLIDAMVIEYHGFPSVGQNLHKILSRLDSAGFRYLIHDMDAETNPATKPPFHIEAASQFFLLIYGRRLFETSAIADADNLVLTPVSHQFGHDRGKPIDRYYIENFLRKNSTKISGTVLEIGDNAYTCSYGSNVSASEVLNYEPAPGATIIGDLVTGRNVPLNQFDCIILTQTLLCIYDVKSALKNAVAALKENGTLLITVPGISQISRYDMDRWGDFWRFTDRSLQMLLLEVAPEASITVETHGNVAVAKAFLDGRALEELNPTLLDYCDQDYQLVITAVLTKKSASAVAGVKAEPLVLIYHRVADVSVDPQMLCVSQQNFDAQLAELARNWRTVPLAQLLDECSNGSVAANTIALTFDDGYLDNLINALPLLEKHRLHATIFVTSGMVGSDEEFWWDALECLLLSGRTLPMELEYAGRKWSMQSQESRLRAYDDLCFLLRDSAPETVEHALQELFAWAGMSRKSRQSHQTVNHRQLKILAESPWIEIGGHAKHHVRLSLLPPQRQYMEIMSCRQQLESLTGKPVHLFSYPFGAVGDFSEETIREVQKAGYTAAIANIQGEIKLPLDKYAVPRRLVRNWNGSDFAAWLHADDKGELEARTVNQRNAAVLHNLT